MRVLGEVQTTYRSFAVYAADNSRCFEQWALGVADDPEVQHWLARLPEPKRQPNLVFAAARWHGLAAPAPYDDLRTALLGDDGRIRATILERATQTNEVGRLATLLPAFAWVPGEGPVGLLEVGASAGLCLYPDRWSYAWATDRGAVTIGSARPTLHAEVSGPVALPDAVPEVVWRGGIDLNPLDAADPDTCRWLLTLVWPEHDDRRARLDAMMRDLLAEPRVHWVSNERPRALPAVTATGPEPPPGRYVLGVDGQAVGHTQQHGRSLHWWS